MNLRTPPEPPPEDADIQQLRDWIREHYDWTLLLYEFLKFPCFHLINLVPRASCADTTEGNVYYDSDDDKLKVRDSDSWNDTY